MNNQKRPTLEELSLHYDGLLDEHEAKQMSEHIRENEISRHILNAFQGIDDAMQPDLADDEVDELLGDTLKNVHERLVKEERLRRPERASALDWLFAPKRLLGIVASMLILFGLFIGLGPDAFQSFDTPIQEEPVVEMSMAQKEAILAVAKLAKSAYGKSVDYAKAETQPLGDSITKFPVKSNIGNVIASSSTGEESDSPMKTVLQQPGTKQIAFGLGASMLSLMTVF